MYAYTWVAGTMETIRKNDEDRCNVCIYMCGDEIFLLEKVRSATILVYILNFADMYVEKIYKCLVKGVENDID